MGKCQTKIAWEKDTQCLWVSILFPLFIFSQVNVHSVNPDVLDMKLEAGRVEITQVNTGSK